MRTAISAAIMAAAITVFGMVDVAPNLADSIRASADRLGISAHDLATVISFETGGKFSPSLWGGKNNNHLGLIQFGGPEREKYGVNPDQSAPEQMGAVEAYLRDRGLKPGMGIHDLYSTINAGRPGLSNRSDAANGGTWGTVADKVNYQMGPHRLKAQALLGGQAPAADAAPAATATAPAAPFSMSPGTLPDAENPAADDGSAALIQSLVALGQQQDEGLQPLQTLHIDYPTPPGLRKATALARARGGRV